MLVSTAPRKVASTRDVANLLIELTARQSRLDKEKEHLWVICLDLYNVVRSVHLVHIGSLSETLVHPREVFRPAVHEGAVKIIIAHNHPNGSPVPSDNDVGITKRLMAAGKILDIEVFDHVVYTDNNGYRSVMEEDNETE